MQVLILYMSLSMFQHSEKKMLCLVSNIYLLLASFARSVRQVMDRVFFLPFMAQTRSARAMKTRKEKTRIHNLPYGPSKRG